ncbi:MAG: SDR family oxidoreductase [Marinobacter sp.]|uniref:SDR family NAD(P)-dependent oxidoreductase n=1 Tax=Marinobacter sp. TaxID=50741 RepID=UPI0039763BF4
MERLKGKVAVITGGAVGIGAATATRMAEEGAAVAILDCQDREGEALASGLSDRGFRAGYWHCDVSSEQEVKQVLDKVADSFGSLTVLVNNAGIAGPNKPTHELTEEEWDAVQNVNVKGVFFCTKHAIPHMKKAGVGSIINLSSIYGLVSAPDIPPYHASKGAVRLMSKTDALIYDELRCMICFT